MNEGKCVSLNLGNEMALKLIKSLFKTRWNKLFCGRVLPDKTYNIYRKGMILRLPAINFSEITQRAILMYSPHWIIENCSS